MNKSFNQKMIMDSEILKNRTKEFSLRIIKLVEALHKIDAGRAIGSQLVRSGTSVWANYRAACRGRSKAEFNAKLHIVLEEADESMFWLEVIIEGGILPEQKVKPLWTEAGELTKIFAKSFSTAKKNI
jgi:four helix bundle protein